MSEEVVLELEKREVTGKSVKQLRQAGYVPAVIHDHGKDSIVVMGNYQKIYAAFQTAGKHHPVVVRANGKAYTALIKSVTFDPRYNSMTHIVFNAVNANQQVEADIPVRIKLDEGNENTPAERAGLIVLHQLESVAVESTPSELPDALEFDGEKLVEVGDHATVADLIVPKGVVVKADPTQTLATVFEPSALAAANDAAGGDAEEAAPAEGEEGAEGGEQPAAESAAGTADQEKTS